MKIYMIYIKPEYYFKLDNYFRNTYICKENMFYCFTVDKKIYEKFKEERNMKAFIVKKIECDEESYKFYKYENMLRELKIDRIQYDEYKSIDIVLTHYEKEAVGEIYNEEFLLKVPDAYKNFNCDILKEKYIKAIERLLLTYMIYCGSDDEDVKFNCMHSFDCGKLPYGERKVTDFLPNFISILNSIIGCLFVGKE